MEPFLGQIILFAGNFAPPGWDFCHGQALNIWDNQDLFNLLQTSYGGDGVSTFNLPDLRGRLPVGSGYSTLTRDRLSSTLGASGGQQEVTLKVDNLPTHDHSVVFKEETPMSNKGTPVKVATTTNPATSPDPGGHVLAEKPTAPNLLMFALPPTGIVGHLGGISGGPQVGDTISADVSLSNSGGQSPQQLKPVSTQPPYLGINYIIATRGIFPNANR